MGSENDPIAKFAKSFLRRCRVYQFHDTSITSHFRDYANQQASSYLYADGGNLAAVLLSLSSQFPEDYTSTSLGNITAGTWSLVNGFDGSLLTGMGAENVSGAWFDGATDDLYLTLTSAFTVGGVSGNQKQVLKVTPARVASIYWNAPTNGYNAAIDGLFIAP